MTLESKAKYLETDTTRPFYFLECERKLHKIHEILNGVWYVEDLPRVITEIQKVVDDK